MRSQIIFIVLLVLSFSVVHDTFFSLVQKYEHTHVVDLINDDSTKECNNFHEIHNMLHFMAIVEDEPASHTTSLQQERISHLDIVYLSPVGTISQKPPIA